MPRGSRASERKERRGRGSVPGEREADEHVKDVGADGRGDSHVAVALSRHDHACEQVRHARARRQEGQTHHRVLIPTRGSVRLGTGQGGQEMVGFVTHGDAKRASDFSRPPDHEVGVDPHPADGREERRHVPLLLGVSPYVPHRHEHRSQEREGDQPHDLPAQET